MIYYATLYPLEFMSGNLSALRNKYMSNQFLL